MHRSPKLRVARPRASGPWARAAPALRLPRVMSIMLIEPKETLHTGEKETDQTVAVADQTWI